MRKFLSATVSIVIWLLVAGADRGVAAATCDPPGPPPRFGCFWSTTDCNWFCAVCDPFGSPPRSSCHWDLAVCNWICPGYTGVDVMARTLQSPSVSSTVYVRLSSLCSSTGVLAACGGHFGVYAGMPLSVKCESIANAISDNCAAAGYAVSSDDCATGASFTASNVGCPGTQFALGVSNDSGVFDETASGPLPDGESETICAPPPGAPRNLRMEKRAGGSVLHLTWDDGSNTDSYVVYEDQVPGGAYDVVVGTAPSGSTGLDLSTPLDSEFFLVAGSNSTCGIGHKE